MKTAGDRRCLLMLMLAVCGAVTVNTIIFKNSNPRSVNIIFSEPIIAENLFLCKKVNNNVSVDVEALGHRITDPKDYMEKVKRAVEIDDPESAYWREVTIKNCTVDLDGIKFQEDMLYSLKIQQLNGRGEFYSEGIVYSDGRLMYAQELKKRHWYTNVWVWASILLMLVVFLFVARACVRRK